MSMLPDPSTDAERAALSALMDGDPGASDEACRAWRGNATARADWHAYHLIGDLMRSDEHRADEVRDARFLAAVRARLADEPVVLAPSPVAASPASTTALDACAPSPSLDGADRGGRGLHGGCRRADGDARLDARWRRNDRGGRACPRRRVVSPALAASQAGVETATMIRSAELDRYLEAHRQYANGATQVAPGGAVRNAAATAPGR